MSNDENASKQAESDASPNVEPDHVEGAPTADNPPATAGPNDSFLDEKSNHRLRVQQLELARLIRRAKRPRTFASKLSVQAVQVPGRRNKLERISSSSSRNKLERQSRSSSKSRRPRGGSTQKSKSGDIDDILASRLKNGRGLTRIERDSKRHSASSGELDAHGQNSRPKSGRRGDDELQRTRSHA